jgi:hypothetical protein
MSELPSKEFTLLTFEPQSGKIVSGESKTILVTVHSKDIPADIYNTSIRILSNDPIFDKIEIPVIIEVYNGLIVPDTVQIVQNEINPVFFTILSDYKTDIRIDAINFAYGSSFDGTIIPADGSTFPVIIAPAQEVTFKAEYTGATTIGGTETVFSTYIITSDVINRDMVIAFTPDEVGINEQPIAKQTVFVFPNPANSSVSFAYSTFQPTSVIISIYDITGKLVKQLPHEAFSSDQQTVTWYFENEMMLNGMYFYSICTEKQKINGKLLIVR